MPKKVNGYAVRVALIYIGVAACWILFSDELLKWLVSNPDLRVKLEIFKGWAFVLVTGGLLYFTMRKLAGRWEWELRQREQAETACSDSVERLRRSEEQLRLVMEASNDGLWDWDVRTGQAQLSSRYWEMTGYSMTQSVPNLDFFKRLVHPEDWPKVRAAMSEHLAGESAQSAVEYRMITRDGSVKWIWGRGKLVERAADGTPLRMVGTVSDITGRKQTEAELVKARAHYQNLLQTSNDGIHVLNQTGELIEANAVFYQMLGYPPENPPKLRVSDWDVKFVGEALQEEIKMDLSHPRLFETMHRRADGRVIEVEINARPIEIGGQRCIYASSRDITARKLAEARLSENEEKFAKMFQSSPVPVTLSSMDEGRYLDVNEEFLKLVQRSRVEVVGHTAVEIGIWDDPAQRPAAIAKVKECGYLRNLELAIRTASGETRYIVWSAESVLIRGEQCLLGTSLDITERKLAEQKMRESEERYRQLFDLESDAVFLVDCETHRFVDVNQSAQRLYGYSRDEFLGMILEAVSDEPKSTHTSVDFGEGFIPLRWHRKKNGERFAVEITANIISHQGRRTKLAAVRDITARQHVMEMLGETTDQLLEAQQIAGLGSYVFEVATGHWTGSEVLGQLFGLSEPGVARDVETWLELVHPQDRADFKNYLYNEVLKSRKPFDRIYRIVRLGDHEVRWVHGLGKLVLDQDGHVVRMVGVIQDITERRLAEERINVQASAMTAAANAIVITDRTGTIEWVNPAFTKLTGYTAEEVVGGSPRMLKSNHHPPAFYGTLWATVLTGNVWHGEIVNRRKDGQLYTEDMTITPVRGADGQVAHFVAVKQDVTDQRLLEKRMQQAQKMEAIGTLAGGIAHDFNNILAAMFGYAYLLQQDTEGIPAAQENIGEILKAAGRAKELVQQILTFSRQREQKPQMIQLDTIIKEAIKFLRASLPAQIKIEMNLDGDAPAVLADPTQIYQVAINLATNALHAMEGRSGKLTIALDHFEPDTKFIQSHPDFRRMPYARLTVADTGHGMDAKTLERIFEPFFTTKPVGKGTGLGLAVVHGIVEAHHGTITVTSEVGRGTEFQLYFPGQVKGADSAVKADNYVPPGRGQNILVLDDEPSLTGALQRLLVRLNYRVAVSNSPREIISLYQKDPAQFDLVITDLTMPEMNGLEVARQLRGLRPDLPIILASGFCADLTRDTLEASGVCELLEKPISRAVLADVVQRALAGGNNHRHDSATNGKAHAGC